MHAMLGFTPGGSVGVGVGGGVRLVENVGVGVDALAGELVELAGELTGAEEGAALEADAMEAAARTLAGTWAAVGLAVDGADEPAAPGLVAVAAVVGDVFTAAGAVAGCGVAMAVTTPLVACL